MSDLHVELSANAFDKQDDGNDLAFYAPPRLVAHIDDTAVSALTAYYARVIPQNAVVLDLMSSWISHLPAALATAEVIGHGMNVVELQANDRLNRWFIADLNGTPRCRYRMTASTWLCAASGSVSPATDHSLR